MKQTIVATVWLCACFTRSAPPEQQQQSPTQADRPGAGANCAARVWPANTCRDDKQCEYGCRAPIDVPVQYGDCTCPAGQVCYARWTGMGSKEACAADCATAKCPEGQRCGANGRCGLVSCVDGYACKAQARCEPGRPGADLHGCVHLACKSDRDCACDAYCVLGKCHAKPGMCSEPPSA